MSLLYRIFFTTLISIKKWIIHTQGVIYAIKFIKFNYVQNNDINAIGKDEIENKNNIIVCGVSRWLEQGKPNGIIGVVMDGCPNRISDLITYSSGF